MIRDQGFIKRNRRADRAHHLQLSTGFAFRDSLNRELALVKIKTSWLAMWRLLSEQ